jgi:hypothetical protein
MRFVDPSEPQRPAPDFERAMVRLSIEDLAAERAHCGDCGRTPLLGEDVHLYEGGRIVCELCRQLRAEPPVSTERVRHSEHGLTVRLRHVA